MNKLSLVAGIIFVTVGYMIKKFDLYYEKTILPTKSNIEQEFYWRIEEEKSAKGAYNVPFKDGELIATNQSKHTSNNFIIIVGIVGIFIGLLGL